MLALLLWFITGNAIMMWMTWLTADLGLPTLPKYMKELYDKENFSKRTRKWINFYVYILGVTFWPFVAYHFIFAETKD